jgi:hypothetical protein
MHLLPQPGKHRVSASEAFDRVCHLYAVSIFYSFNVLVAWTTWGLELVRHGWKIVYGERSVE